METNVARDLELFCIRPYRQKRLSEYFKRMSKDDNSVIYDPNVGDVLRAQGYQFEETPRSVYKVDKLYAALSAYAPGKIPQPKASEYFTSGISLAYKCFSRPSDVDQLHVLPMTPATIAKVTSNPSGSPGLTNYGCTKAESQTRALERGLQIMKGEKQPEPCLAFKRTQFNDKTRLVWGFPYSMTVIEGLLANPLISLFKGRSTPMAFAMPTVALGAKLRTASYHKNYCYSLDMSQFDATISAKLIHLAFKVLRTWFDPDEIEPVSGLKVSEIFRIVERYFIHTTIVMPDGHIYIGKRHGVPSGSYFTQIVDSIVNVIIIGAISARFNLFVSRKDIFVLGDDILFWTNRRISLDVISKWANENFFVKLHGSEKSAIFQHTETLHFLGRDWSNGLPDLPVKDILARMAYAERFRKYDDDPKIRERQVRMLFLSFAATYRKAWSIAYDCLDGSNRNIHRGCNNLDVNTFCRGQDDRRVDPDHLTGLMRYRRKYVYSEGEDKDIPCTAYQYCL